MPSIERLESRIAPATLTGNVLTYADSDGDAVTITFKTKGTLEAGNFTFDTAFANAGPQKLRLIDLSGSTTFAKASITATVVQQGGGNGKVDIGRINATGFDLGKVLIPGDLGRIDAGDSNPSAGLALLDVGSLGAQGAAQVPGGSLESTIFGKVGSLVVAGGVDGAAFVVSGGSKAGIGKISVGGSLLGSIEDDSGSIQATGSIGKVTIGGGLVGGNGERSGFIFAGGKMGAVTVGDSLQGGIGDQSGSLFAEGKMGAVVVTGGLVGGDGSESGQIDSGDALKSAMVGFITGGTGADSGGIDSDGNTAFVTVLGNILGGDEDEAGHIEVDGNLGKLRVAGFIKGGSLGESGVEVGGNLGTALIEMGIEGGDGNTSGSIVVGESDSGGKIGKLTIIGSLKGGGGVESGSVAASSRIGIIEITQDLEGGGDTNSGQIYSLGDIGKVLIGGSIIGGSGIFSGYIDAEGTLGSAEITGNLEGGGGIESGVIFANLGMKKVSIEGSIIAGTNTLSGAIDSNGPIGSLFVGTDITGTAVHRVSITGDAKPQGGVAIKTLTVVGNVAFTDILAGYNDDTPTNANAQIGSILIDGSFTASNIVAGVRDVNGDGFGNADDLSITPDGSVKISSIAKIVIGNLADGTVGGVDHFGLTAQVIKSLTVNGAPVLLSGGASNDLLLALPGVTTGDFTLNEVA